MGLKRDAKMLGLQEKQAPNRHVGARSLVKAYQCKDPVSEIRKDRAGKARQERVSGSVNTVIFKRGFYHEKNDFLPCVQVEKCAFGGAYRINGV